LSPSRDHWQLAIEPARRQPSRCSRFTSIERQASTWSRPEPGGRPGPKPPITRLPFYRHANRLSRTFAALVKAFERVRNKGRQTVVVQHVYPSGQAVGAVTRER
jgi:hypothetical protein